MVEVHVGRSVFHVVVLLPPRLRERVLAVKPFEIIICIAGRVGVHVPPAVRFGVHVCHAEILRQIGVARDGAEIVYAVVDGGLEFAFFEPVEGIVIAFGCFGECRHGGCERA